MSLTRICCEQCGVPMAFCICARPDEMSDLERQREREIEKGEIKRDIEKDDL